MDLEKLDGPLAELNDVDSGSDNESSTAGYYTEVSALLVSVIEKHFESTTADDEFEIQRLVARNREADKSIVSLLKNIEEETKLSAEFNRKIQSSDQQYARAAARKQRTGNILKILKDEIEKMKTCAELKQEQVKNLKQNLKTYHMNKNQINVNKEKISHLENEIQKALKEKDAEEKANENESNLIIENRRLKGIYNEKCENIQTKIVCFENIQKLKSDYNKILEQMYEKQKEIDSLNKTLCDKKDKSMSLKEEMDRVEDEMNERLNQQSLKQSDLQIKIEKTSLSNVKNQAKFNDLEKQNLELETKLNQLKLKIEQTEADLNHKLETEKCCLKEVTENCNYLSEEVDKLKSGFQEKCLIKADIENYKIKILETKKLCAKQEVEAVKAQHKLSLVVEQVNLNNIKIASLTAEKSQLDKEISRMEESIDNASEILNKKLQGLNADFNADKDQLVKQGEFLKAAMELLDVNLRNMQKEIESDYEQKRDLESQIKLVNVKLDVLRNTVKIWTDRLEKEQADCRIALEMYDKEVKADNEEVELPPENIEKAVNALEDNTQSGRKSPGILKSPKSPKSPTKSVRFEGLSSGESKSSFDVEMEKYKQTVKRQSFDEESDSSQSDIPRFRPPSRQSLKKRNFD